MLPHLLPELPASRLPGMEQVKRGRPRPFLFAVAFRALTNPHKIASKKAHEVSRLPITRSLCKGEHTGTSMLCVVVVQGQFWWSNLHMLATS